MFDWIADFFKSLVDFIPKIMYLLYASLACLLDIFQLALRKLAGLDVYYAADGTAVAGDIVTNFIAGILGIRFDGTEKSFDYSILSTVFWALVVFGLIITFVSVFVALIKSHYNYDEKAAKGGPMQYVYAGLKAILNIAVVPIIVVLGLYVSQAVLTALDSITAGSTAAEIGDFNTADLQSVSTSRALAGNSQNSNERTYLYYDIFGFGSEIFYSTVGVGHNSWSTWELGLTAATTQTFSGVLFKAAAYNGNRARTGKIVVGNTSIYGLEEGGIFSNPRENNTRTQQQALADMIDTAFACNLHLSDSYLGNSAHTEVKYTLNGAAEWTSAKYLTTFFTKSISAFSKFNIGAVWYYYDLWNFNFIVGFGAVIICVSLFINIILGLMTRIFMCLGLFLIAPPLFGLAPLDGGNAAKGWRENFMKQVLMAYGSILGMNIFFIIFPLINQIKFFNFSIGDLFMETLFIIVGLISIKAFIAMVSGLVGGEDANKTGEGMKEEVGSTMGKAVKMTTGAAKMAVNAGRAGGHLLGAGFNAIRAGNSRLDASIDKQNERIAEAANAQKNKLIDDALKSKKEDGSFDEAALRANAAAAGMSPDQIDAMANAVKNSSSKYEARANYAANASDSDYIANELKAQRAKASYAKNMKKAEAAKKSLKLAGKSGFEAVKGAWKLTGDTLTGDKGVTAFVDKIWHKPTAEERTANAMEAMQKSWLGEDKKDAFGRKTGHADGAVDKLFGNEKTGTKGAFADLGEKIDAGTAATTSGFTDMGNRVDAGTAETRKMGTSVTGAVISTREKLSSKIDANTSATNDMKKQIDDDLRDANKHLDDIQKDTANIKATADQQEQHLAKIQQKAERVVKQNARESRRLKSIMDSSRETKETVKKINKKL